ncbi:MAG: MarR family transcriptional regulator [Chloroflexi bacterium]|nr:MarR family transcriptional regulator [Chloroflexota bacterium]
MDDNALQLIEEFGMYFESVGLTRMAGRIIGFLLICDPPHQSMPDIVEALGAAKSSISTALWQLQQLYLVERFRIPGERRDFFRASSDMWNRSFRARMHQVTALRELAERGLGLLDDAPDAQRKRLELMRDHNQFIETEFPKLLDRWDDIKRQKGYE